MVSKQILAFRRKKAAKRKEKKTEKRKKDLKKQKAFDKEIQIMNKRIYQMRLQKEKHAEEIHKRR